MLLNAVVLLLSVSPCGAAEMDAKPLAVASEATFQAVNALLSTQRDKERIGRLKSLVDEAGRAGDASAAAARGLADESSAAREDMAARSKRADLTLEKRQELSESRERWAREVDAVKKVKEELARSRKKNREHHEERLKKAQAELAAAAAALGLAEESFKELAESRSAMKESQSRAKTAAEELQAASSDMAGRAAQLREAGGPAKAAIDALGQEPKEQAGARAWRKIQAVVEEGKGVWTAADIALHRADDFLRRHSTFAKEDARFQMRRGPAAAALSEAKTRLDAAETVLSELRAWLDEK